MRRDELRQPLRKRSLGERLWARRPTALQLASVSFAVMLSGVAVWLIRTPQPFGGEPVVRLKIPPVSEVMTASVDKPEEAEAPAEKPAETTEPDIEILPDDRQAVQTDSAIIITPPRRALAPAPIAAVSEEGPYGPLPRIGSGNKKPSDVYARRVPAGIAGSETPKIAIVLGGMGLNEELTRKAIKALPGDITFAFAPYGENLQPLVNKARAAGHEIMLQLPMEPVGYPGSNPGPKTLLTGVDKNANLDALSWHMGRFSGYTGIMNYMGGRFLSEPAAARPVLAEMKQRGLIYLDDNPSGRSKAAEIGREVGLKVRETTVTIDADANAAAIAGALDRLEEQARRNGYAVGSGAGLGVTIDTVESWAKELDERGIVLVPVSAIFKGRSG